MQIGGYVKQSLIDWPGRIVAVLFTRGCNFRCGYCHNPHLVLPELLRQHPCLDPDRLIAHLGQRTAWLDGVVVSGGEPTLHPDLPQLMERLKGLGYSLKLDTNGTNPAMIERLIAEGLVQHIALDIKTVLDDGEYQRAVGCRWAGVSRIVSSSLGIIRRSGVPYQLRTTMCPQLHPQATRDRLMREFEGDNYCLQEVRPLG